MSDPNRYQPDQPYDELDIAKDPLQQWATDGDETAEPEDFTPREHALVKMALDAWINTLPAPEFPPGLPPKLRQLMEEEGHRNGILPPDTPQ